MLTLFRYLIPEKAMNYIDERGLFRDENRSNHTPRTSQSHSNGPPTANSLDGQIEGVPTKS